MAESSDTYDQIPYPSFPSRRSHICHLAAIGRLFGLEVPSPRTARVLELGCAAGGNILPMAGDFPDARFVGIDLSPRQVQAGQEVIDAVGFTNITLRQGDLLTLDTQELGQFDYIICHGVYSWVPRVVQDRILSLSRECLAPRGILFCSFNAYPGWHLRGMVREMLTYHVASYEKATDRIHQARSLLAFLIEFCSGPSDVYKQILKEELDILKAMGDSYMFHEHLETHNEPLYFHQFIERVAEAKLQYLADTDFASMLADNLGEGVAKLLAGAPLDRSEQYLDFLNGRTFRGALLCQQSVRPVRQVAAERLIGCSVALEDKIATSTTEDGMLVAKSDSQTISVRHPLIKTILLVLQQQEACWMSFDELVLAVAARTGQLAGGAGGGQLRLDVAGDLLTLYSKRVIRVWVDAPSCTPTPGQRPLATTLARWQAREKLPITNRRHEHVRTSPPEMLLMSAMDGSLDRTGLRDRLAAAIARGDFEVHEEGRPVDKAKIESRHVDELFNHFLSSLSQRAMIVA